MPKQKSVLVKSIGINDEEELMKYINTSKKELRIVAKRIILEGETYKKASDQFGMSKQSVYEFLKRIYEKKYGKEYKK